jgi:DNA-binding NarL/FixJ family response regulator
VSDDAAVVRVLLVDDQELIRSGLRRILRRRSGFEVVAECADGSEVLAALAGHSVDVILMDLRMKDVDGVEATRLVRSDAANPPVLVLTTFDDDELVSGALRAGAAGCPDRRRGRLLARPVRHRPGARDLPPPARRRSPTQPGLPDRA